MASIKLVFGGAARLGGGTTIMLSSTRTTLLDEAKMQYPICIEWIDEHTAVGIQIPDIPGAVTAGDTLEDAYTAAVEVAHIMLEGIAGSRQTIPMPNRAVEHRENPDFVGMDWGMLEIDITRYLGET